ncbi:MAG: hypothetical protein ACK6CT_14730 [Planctomycetia bacterium]|jgi:hypothetical protein
MVAANKSLLKLVRRLAIRDEVLAMRRRAGLLPPPLAPARRPAAGPQA